MSEQEIDKAVKDTLALRCPVCGGPNDCGAVLNKVCWCEKTPIPTALRRHTAAQCICRTCAIQYAREVDAC